MNQPKSVMVGVRLAVVEASRGPHLIGGWALEQLLGVEGGVPFGEVENVEVCAPSAVVLSWAKPIPDFESPFDQAIAWRGSE
jgi:hypothetical protein